MDSTEADPLISDRDHSFSPKRPGRRWNPDRPPVPPNSSSRHAPTLYKTPALSQSLTSMRFAQGDRSRLGRERPSLNRRANRWTGRLTAVCTCNTFNLQALFQLFLDGGYHTRRVSRDVVHVEYAPTHEDPDGDADVSAEIMHSVWSESVEDTFTNKGDIFLFSYGVVVSWGLQEGAEWKIWEILKNSGHENGRLADEGCRETFDYGYMTDEENDHQRGFVTADHDLILVQSNLSHDDLVRVKVAASHSVAQSMKLESFESAIEGMFRRMCDHPVEMANHGDLTVKSTELRKLSGELCTYKLYINLQTDILVTPDWFWDNSRLEPVYDKVAGYLDIRRRVSVLNHRLSVLQEMNELFRDAQTSEYGHRLEWIIIVLILVEVLLDLLNLSITMFRCNG